MRVPRLHVVTDDDVVGRRAFRSTAESLVQRLGPGVALHLRGHGTAARRLHALADTLAEAARASGAALLVNDRVDLALAAGATGVQLGRRSIPVQAARSLMRRPALIGYSAHGVDEGVSAVANGADFLLLGTIWDTPSHPGRRGAGVERIRAARERLDVPLVAIGGVTVARAREALEAGADGVAVIRGVWTAADPVAAAAEYLRGMEGVRHER